jgi:mannose-6-phosphate isomerase-like protein (cupin superfamily)
MSMLRLPSFQSQADGTEAAMLVSGAELFGDAGAAPPGLEVRRLAPRRQSWLFSMPAATLVVHGIDEVITLVVQEGAAAPRAFALARGDCYAAPPGTILQLRNDGDEPRQALLVTSPARLRELEGKRVTHDDAVVVGRDWDEVNVDVQPGELAAQRAEAMRRHLVRRGQLEPRAHHEVQPACAAMARRCAHGAVTGLVAGCHVAMAHHELADGEVTASIRHRTVEQLWHVLSGRGELWRTIEGEARVDVLGPGDSVCVRPGVSFQLRALDGPLRAVVASAPSAPGPGEAVAVPGRW